MWNLSAVSQKAKCATSCKLCPPLTVIGKIILKHLPLLKLRWLEDDCTRSRYSLIPQDVIIFNVINIRIMTQWSIRFS